MASATSARQTSRHLLAWIGLVVLGLAMIYQLRHVNIVEALGLADYVAYWAAGRLMVSGENPYSWDDLLRLQHELGWPETYPNMMYYPPWTLPLVMLLGAPPYGLSRCLWLPIGLGLIGFCTDRIWRFYRGPVSYRWVAWSVAFSFIPTLVVLRMGQIGPVLLVGIVGFLYFQERRRDWLAGAALLLPAIKPQLVYLFGVAVLAWAADQRRWRILGGGVLAFLGAVGLALLWNPHVLDQYRVALANPPVVNVTPTIGGLLRLTFGGEHVWLQYPPTILGMLWFCFYWRKHRHTWSWAEQAPLLVLVSFLTTAYGAWIFDLVVLLLPLLQASAWVASRADSRLTRIALGIFLAINGVALAMNLAEVTYPAFIWMTPAILVGYLVLRRQVRPAASLKPGTTG
jgi:hypothetical protein